MALRTAGLLRQFAVTGLGWRFMPTRQLRRFQPAVDRQPKWVTADEAVSVIQSGLLHFSLTTLTLSLTDIENLYRWKEYLQLCEESIRSYLHSVSPTVV